MMTERRADVRKRELHTGWITLRDPSERVRFIGVYPSLGQQTVKVHLSDGRRIAYPYWRVMEIEWDIVEES